MAATALFFKIQAKFATLDRTQRSASGVLLLGVHVESHDTWDTSQWNQLAPITSKG